MSALQSDERKAIKYLHRLLVGEVGTIPIEAVEVQNADVGEEVFGRSIEVAEVWFQNISGEPFTDEALKAKGLTIDDLCGFCQTEEVRKKVGEVIFPVSGGEDFHWFFTVKRIGTGDVIAAVAGHPDDIAKAQTDRLLEL